MSFKLKDRIQSYKDAADHKLMNRLPTIISVNGRAFQKSTSLLDKPFCDEFSTCMISTMSYLCNQIDGVCFAYHFNDEIILVLRNDQSFDTQAWCDNKIQKIASLTSSISTLYFNQLVSATELNILNDAVFYTQVFSTPSIQEAINTIIFKQQSNFYSSVNYACFYELLNKYNEGSIKEMMQGLSIDEKKDLLSEECQIEFNNYPSIFRKGAASYKVPKIVDGKIKQKWAVNKDVPVFSKDVNFLTNIFKQGADIIRQDSF